MGYLVAFLFGAGAGFLPALFFGRSVFARCTGGLGELLVPVYVVLIGGASILNGGFAGVIALSLWRGEPLTGFGICLSIIVVLWLAFKIRTATRTVCPLGPKAVRAAQEQDLLARRRRAFFEDYGRFLRAAIDGELPVIQSFLDAGMPYVAPLPGVVPRYPRPWAESIVESAEIQRGVSIFRYSALELAARYGQTATVALLLTRDTGNTNDNGNHRSRALSAARFYRRDDVVRLLEGHLA